MRRKRPTPPDKALAASQRLARALFGVSASRNGEGYMVLNTRRVDGRRRGGRLLHRAMAELALGRALDASEEVHHNNHVRWDCRWNNLVLVDAFHASSRCPYTGRFNGHGAGVVEGVRLGEVYRKSRRQEGVPF